MQCTMMSGVQCLRAPSTVALKQSTCSPSVRLQASSLTTNPLRSQQACRQINVKRGSHTAVQAAAADSATFYDYAVKVRPTNLSSSITMPHKVSPFFVLISYSCYRAVVLMLLQDIDGRDTQMKKFKGKVVLAVNVASQCGFTKQYQVEVTGTYCNSVEC